MGGPAKRGKGGKGRKGKNGSEQPRRPAASRSRSALTNSNNNSPSARPSPSPQPTDRSSENKLDGHDIYGPPREERDKDPLAISSNAGSGNCDDGGQESTGRKGYVNAFTYTEEPTQRPTQTSTSGGAGGEGIEKCLLEGEGRDNHNEEDLLDLNGADDNDDTSPQGKQPPVPELETNRSSGETATSTSTLGTIQALTKDQISTLSKEAFPCVKFVMEDDLDYGSKFCEFIMNRIELAEEVDKVEYWKMIRMPLKKKLEQLRNARITDIKKAFMGKTSLVVCV